MTQQIIDLFGNLCLPFVDKIGGEKQEYAQQWLSNHGIENEYIPGIGIIANKQENPRIVLVSHIDLIKKFRKGFIEGRTFEIEGNILRGALDNTITNSVALWAFKHIIDQGVQDVELLLSEGEEVGMVGMDAYIKALKLKSKNTFFLNLDVTNEGYNQHCSVEYDKPNFEIFKKIELHLDQAEIDSFYTHYRVGDDTDAVIKHNCAGLSYCIPTDKTIHSYKNECLISSIDPYYRGLVSLLINLTYSNPESNFKGYHLSLAKTVETFEELEEEIKKYIPPPSKFAYQGGLWDDDDLGETDWIWEKDTKPGKRSNSFGYSSSRDSYPQGFDETPWDDDDTNPWDEEDYEDPYGDIDINASERLIEVISLTGLDTDKLYKFIINKQLEQEWFSFYELEGVMDYESDTRYLIDMLIAEKLLTKDKRGLYKLTQ